MPSRLLSAWCGEGRDDASNIVCAPLILPRDPRKTSTFMECFLHFDDRFPPPTTHHPPTRTQRAPIRNGQKRLQVSSSCTNCGPQKSRRPRNLIVRHTLITRRRHERQYPRIL